MINDIFRRYGIGGVLINLLSKCFMIFNLKVELFSAWKLSLEHLKSDQTHRITNFTIAEMCYSDLEKYGDKEWFTEEKLASLKPLFCNEGHHVYGIIENNLLICYGWISLNTFGTYSLNLKETDGYLWDDYTHPSYRGKKLHSYITDFRLNKLREYGKQFAYSFVANYNKASRKGYVRIGFIEEQTFVNYQLGKGKAQTTFKYNSNESE